MDIPIIITQIISFVLLGCIILFKTAGTSYINEKGKNLATKQDINGITKEIENVKAEIIKRDRVDEKKFELKYKACLDLLDIVDAQLTHTIVKDNEGLNFLTDKQFVTTGVARRCHNELLITIDNNEIIETFLKIMLDNEVNPIVELTKLRQLVREELGFGNEVYVDERITWLATIQCEDKGN